MTRQRVVFFGSGPVALQNLTLVSDMLDLEAVITKPATEAVMRDRFPGVPIFAVSNRRELDSLVAESHFTSQVGLLIDFGIIVSQQAIDAFPKGIINSHFSLLPEWRGADPISFAILSGQKRTGVSLMLLTVGMDEGPLLAQAAYEITAKETTETLTESMIKLSAHLLHDTLPAYVAGTVDTFPQQEGLLPHRQPTYSRKLTKEDGRLDWHKRAAELEREVRAFQTWPHSFTELAGKEVTITAAQVLNIQGEPGTVHTDKKRLIIYCAQDALEILSLKPAGKKEMSAAAFLAGYGRLFI